MNQRLSIVRYRRSAGCPHIVLQNECPFTEPGLPVQLRADPGSLKVVTSEVRFDLVSVDDPTLSASSESRFTGPRGR